MTRRDWWLGIVLLALVILSHAMLPRYEFTPPDPSSGRPFGMRFDRWTGRAEQVPVPVLGLSKP